MMNNDMFQKIYESLKDVLPETWERVVFRADYTDGSYSMKYYVDKGDGNYIDCYQLSSISKAQLVNKFIDINKFISRERSKTDNKEKWSVMTMMITSKGDFKTEFDYADISENLIAYQAAWKKKYLK